MNKPRALFIALTVLVVAFGTAHWRGQTPAPALEGPDRAIAALSAHRDDAGFARALESRDFVFPRDHASHDNFRSEWWYFTGHLHDAKARPWGFQLTLFRFELSAEQTASVSKWRTPQVLLGHFALTDIAGQQFHTFERLSRALPAIAGTRITPPAVWLDDWRIEQQGEHGWFLRAGQDGVEIELDLVPSSAVVLQGEAGLSRKSGATGNASYYYSLPRLAARGHVRLADGTHPVEGLAWLDREWSTSALSREQAGWDWFAVQLDDGGSLMFYRLRHHKPGHDTFSAGTYVDSRGGQHALRATDVAIEVLGEWHSAKTGRDYPQGWRLRVPSAALDLTLLPRLADQEWRARFHYWEGAVSVTQAGQPAGLGYVELTGYGPR